MSSFPLCKVHVTVLTPLCLLATTQNVSSPQHWVGRNHSQSHWPACSFPDPEQGHTTDLNLSPETLLVAPRSDILTSLTLLSQLPPQFTSYGSHTLFFGLVMTCGPSGLSFILWLAGRDV